jgi:ketosteroid isomerase-like protein
MLMFDVPPPLQSKGLRAYRKTWDLFFSWARDPAVFDIVEMQVTAGAEVGFVTALMRCAGTEASGVEIELDFRLTIGLRKTDGQWTVTHEHHSIPAAQ